jgi:CRP/FNR family transcriptional regulator, anaerobic regulatory protein
MSYRTSLRSFLSTHTLLSDKNIEHICSLVKSVHLKPGEMFIKAGAKSSHSGFLLEGILSVHTSNDYGYQCIKYFVCENQFFADIDSFYKGEEAGTSLIAAVPCHILQLLPHELDALYREVEGFEAAFMRIRELSLLNILILKDVLHHRSVTQQYHALSRRYPHIVQRVPLKHIAQFLNVTQSSLSRIRRNMH